MPPFLFCLSPPLLLRPLFITQHHRSGTPRYQQAEQKGRSAGQNESSCRDGEPTGAAAAEPRRRRRHERGVRGREDAASPGDRASLTAAVSANGHLRAGTEQQT
ncbi:Hypothetical predicted protein [Xyrichtys novacula]|uniref:Uncharacterized protein n=1 Tax=Xyrichtys novacula TaxID=13765 RepID=A0AAV1HEB9_XYRNO|nr:Hypothetical predicted protein [Xyrichtys novacula]